MKKALFKISKNFQKNSNNFQKNFQKIKNFKKFSKPCVSIHNICYIYIYQFTQ